MALKSTIFKADLQVSDLDRQHYGTYALTVARHPSETDERMMVRILAFALNAGERLEFGKGLSTDEEPDLWLRDYTGAIEQWIDVGLPDPKRLRKASGRSPRVRVYTYGGRGVDVWWRQNGGDLGRISNLSVINLPPEATQAMAALAERSMALQCTIQDCQLWFGTQAHTLSIQPVALLQAAEENA